MSSTQLHVHRDKCLVVLCVLTDPFLDMNNVCLCAFVWQLIHYCANLWLLLWTQISRVHSSVVRAADCRAAGPWFNSGWRSWFTSVTWSNNLTSPTTQMFNSMSPITRKSVKMVAEQDNDTAQWIFDNPRLDTVFGECNMTSEQQAATPTTSGAQAPPFTVERRGFLEEFMRVQDRNHEAAIHQLQDSHAVELGRRCEEDRTHEE